MQLEDLRPEHVEDVTLANFEALGLPPDVMADIRERGIRFRWNSTVQRYIAEIPKQKPRKRSV